MRVATMLFVGLCTGRALAGETLPISYIDVGENLNPNIAKIDMSERVGEATCNNRPKRKRNVCSYRIGTIASLTATARKTVTLAEEITATCLVNSLADADRCMGLFTAILQSAAPDVPDGERKETIDTLVSGLTVGDFIQIRADAFRVTAKKNNSVHRLSVAASNVPMKNKDPDDVTALCIADLWEANSAKCIRGFASMLRLGAPDRSTMTNEKIVDALLSGLRVADYVEIHTGETRVSLRNDQGAHFFAISDR